MTAVNPKQLAGERAAEYVEDNMIVGSDYGHEDQSRETGVVAMMRSREDIPTNAIEKILTDNPSRFYGL